MKKKSVVTICLVVSCLFCVFAYSLVQSKKREALTEELYELNDYFSWHPTVGSQDMLVEFKETLKRAKDAGVDVYEFEKSVPKKEKKVALASVLELINIGESLPTDHEIEKAKRLFGELKRNNTFPPPRYLKRGFKMIEERLLFLKVERSMQDLLRPIFYGEEPPSQEGLKEIEMTLIKYDVSDRVEIYLEITPKLTEAMMHQYPTLEKDLGRIYH